MLGQGDGVEHAWVGGGGCLVLCTGYWDMSRCWVRVTMLSGGGRGVWCCAQVLEPE